MKRGTPETNRRRKYRSTSNINPWNIPSASTTFRGTTKTCSSCAMAIPY